MGTVGDVLDTFQLLLSRLWTIGLLFVTASVCLLVAPRFNIGVPPVVSSWAGVGLLFGIACIITSFALWLVSIAKQVGAIIFARLVVTLEERSEGKAAVANLPTLDETEIVTLLNVLSSSQVRFEVAPGSVPLKLAAKKILRVVDTVGGSRLQGPRSYMVELAPSISAKGDALRRDLLATVKGDPFRFAGIGYRYITSDDLQAAASSQSVDPK